MEVSLESSTTPGDELCMEVSLESSTTSGDELRCTIPEETTGFCNRLIPPLPPYDIARFIRLPQVSVL